MSPPDEKVQEIAQEIVATLYHIRADRSAAQDAFLWVYILSRALDLGLDPLNPTKKERSSIITKFMVAKRIMETITSRF